MKGLIYIIKNEDGECYVGSTTQEMERRLSSHKYNSNPILKSKYNIEILEEYECETELELRQKETEYIIANRDTCINKVMKSTKEELRKRILERKKIYTKEHKEDKRLYDIEYRKNNHIKIDCECGGCYYKKHKTQHFKTNMHINYMKK